MRKDKQNDKVQQEIEVEYVEVRPIPALNIAELEEINCVKPVGSDTYLQFHCAPKSRYHGICPKCKKLSVLYSNGYARDRRAHDINMGVVQVEIIVRTPRYKCNNCDATFSHPFESLLPNKQFTSRLYAQLKQYAISRPYSDVADEYGISITKVNDILIEHGAELEAGRKIKAPRVLGLDEKHIVHEKRGVFADIEQGILLEMTPDNKTQTMISTIESFEGYAENIEIVTIDMHTGYVSVVHECLPNATIIIDRFHVIQNLYKKIGKTRKLLFAHLKAIVKALPDGEEKTRKEDVLTRLGSYAYLYKFGKKKLAEKEERISLMLEVCEVFPEFNTLRLLKEGLEEIYEAKTRKEAEERYAKWVDLIPYNPKRDAIENELYAAIHTLRRTMDKWHTYIFAYFDARYTNAATEGLNRLIEAINHKGFGYGFEALRIKALFNKSSSDRTRKEIKRYKVYKFNTQKKQLPEGMMGYVKSVSYGSEPEYTYELETVEIPGSGGVFIDKLLEEIHLIF